MKKTLKLVKSKSAKRKNITLSNSFSSFDNSFTSFNKKNSLSNILPHYSKKENDKNHLIDKEIIIEDASPPRMLPFNNLESFEVEITSDHSSDENNFKNVPLIKQSFDINTVLDTNDWYFEPQVCRRRYGSKRIIEDGYEQKLNTFLRRNKSERAVSNYITKFVKEPEFIICGNKETAKLFILRFSVSYNFFQAWTKRLDKFGNVIIMLTLDQSKTLEKGSIVVLEGKINKTVYYDKEIWYNIEHISVSLEDDRGHHNDNVTKVISVACDCLVNQDSDQILECPNSQRNIEIIKLNEFGFEKKFNRNSFVVLKKLKFWFNSIIRHCLILAQFNNDNFGVMYVTDRVFETISECCIYSIKGEFRLPDSDNIYGSLKEETQNYISYIYGKMCLTSQKKIISFIGKSFHRECDDIFNCNVVTNFDGRLCTMVLVQNQFIEYLPPLFNMDNIPDSSRFSFTGVALFCGIEACNQSGLMNVYVLMKSVKQTILEIIIGKSCLYPSLAGSAVCQISFIDCYKIKGRMIADQFTSVSARYINKTKFASILLKKMIKLRSLSDLFHIPSRTFAICEGMYMIEEIAEKKIYNFCKNCFTNVLETKICSNCFKVDEENLHLYEYNVCIKEGSVIQKSKFMTQRNLSPVETMLIIGGDCKVCLLLDL